MPDPKDNAPETRPREEPDSGARLPGVGKLTVIGGGTAGTGSIGTTSGDVEGSIPAGSSGGPSGDAIEPGGETRIGSVRAGGREEPGEPGSLGLTPSDESAPTTD